MDARFIRAVETVAAGDEIGAGSVYGEVGAKLVVTLLFPIGVKKLWAIHTARSRATVTPSSSFNLAREGVLGLFHAW